MNSFYMGIRNMKLFSATNTIGFIMGLLGKGQIVAGTAWLCLLITQNALPEVENPMLPAIFSAVIAYLIATLFLSIFDFSALAILQCFITQEEAGAPRSQAPEFL